MVSVYGESANSGMRLTVATYNIHAGVGVDGQFQPGRIVQVLQELKANIIALQEVEHHAVGDHDLLDYLAIETKSTAIAGPLLLRGTRDYGNALLTTLPVLSINRVDLSLPKCEPRGALDVVLNWNGLRVQVVATHLGLRCWERRSQVRRLLSLFDSSAAEITIFMGDINEWFFAAPTLRWLHGYFQQRPATYATYPARLPVVALDRIWLRPKSFLADIAVHSSCTARAASDHLPLKAIIER